MSRGFWKRWAKTGPNSVASSFRTLGWNSSGPKALEGFKPLRSLVTPSFETTMSSMEGGRPEKWDLTMITFVEHICKLTIKFLGLFNFWSCITSSSSSFKGKNILIVFFLNIDVPIAVSRIFLNVADKVIYIQIMRLPNIILNFSSQSCKFWSEFLTAHLFCFSMSFVSSIFLLISEVIQGTEETVRLVLDGMRLSAKSWIKEVIKLHSLVPSKDLANRWVKYNSKDKTTLLDRVVFSWQIGVMLSMKTNLELLILW